MVKLRVVSLASLVLVGSALVARAQAASGSTPVLRHGFAADRLARVDRFLQEYVDSNRIGGAVLLVLRDGNVVYERVVGWADREAGRRMTPDAMFRIASQTKALTTVAVMMLVEEGKIALGDRVSRFIPAYARTSVMTRDGHALLRSSVQAQSAGRGVRERYGEPRRSCRGGTARPGTLRGRSAPQLSGGAGLVSTARDYARFLQMLLNGGELGGVRLLSPNAVHIMTSNQVGTLYGRGQGFGFGFSIVEEPGADNSLATRGTYGWGGAYASLYRVDPTQRIVTVFMINQTPNHADIRDKVVNLVYQALVK